MHWYKIIAEDGKDDIDTHVGSSPDSPATMVEKAARGEYIVLSDLLYREDGRIKEWSEWDDTMLPVMYINPRTIIAIMEFKGDPREL